MLFIRLLSKLPLRVLYVLSSILSFLACHVVRYRRKVVERNIELCLTQLSKEERRRVVRKFYRHFGDLVVETLWFGGCRDREKLHRQHLVEITNPQDILAIGNTGKSVMILCSHMGNWELSGGVFNYNYTSVPQPYDEKNYVVAYKALSSKWWDDFMRKNRTAPLDDPEHFEGCLESQRVLHYALSHRREQKFYCFITDQRPYRAAKGSLPVTFLGQSCETMAAAANLAQHFGYAVVYQRMLNVSRGHYIWEYVTIAEDATQTTPQAIMDRYYELLSADIQTQPEQYLWTHKRFGKTVSYS